MGALANRFNQFWNIGVKPIKEALNKKLDASKIANNGTTTVPGYALDARQANPDIEGTLANQVSKINSKLSNHDFSNTSLPSGTTLAQAVQILAEKVFPKKYDIIKNGILQNGITFNTQLNAPNPSTYSSNGGAYVIRTSGNSGGLATSNIINSGYTKLVVDISCTSTDYRFLNAQGYYGQGVSIPNSRSLVELDVASLSTIILAVSSWNVVNNISIYNAYLV